MTRDKSRWCEFQLTWQIDFCAFDLTRFSHEGAPFLLRHFRVRLMQNQKPLCVSFCSSNHKKARCWASFPPEDSVLFLCGLSKKSLTWPHIEIMWRKIGKTSQIFCRPKMDLVTDWDPFGRWNEPPDKNHQTFTERGKTSHWRQSRWASTLS